MRSIVRTLALTVWCCGGALVAAGAQRDIASGPVAAAAAATGGAQDADWPCFLLQEGPQFTAALERDLDASRQRLLTKVGGDAASDATLCPAAARALADFRRDLTTVFDASISKQSVLDRLRPRWTRRWTAAQCEEVAALAKSAKADTLMPAADPRAAASAATATSSLPDLVARWLRSAEASLVLRDKPVAQRIRETLIDLRSELEAVQRDANAALARTVPPIMQRDKQAALTAIDSCIATEEKRLERAPGAPGSSSSTNSTSSIGSTTPASSAEPPISPNPGAALSIDPPAPFVVTRGQRGPIAILKISSSTGKPVAADDDGALCHVVFREVRENAGVSQEEINQRVNQPQWQTDVLASLRSTMDVDPGRPIERLGIRGMEFVGARKLQTSGPAPARRVRVYLVMLETPKGHTTLTCTTPADGFSDALPQFRTIRDTIRPPR